MKPLSDSYPALDHYDVFSVLVLFSFFKKEEKLIQSFEKVWQSLCAHRSF